MRDRDIEKLLSMLDEPSVQSKIRRIVKGDAVLPDPDHRDREQHQIEELKEEIQRQRAEVEKKKQASMAYERELRRLQDELKRTNAQLSEANQVAQSSRIQLEETRGELRKVNDALKSYKACFDLPLGIYEQYRSLPGDIRMTLGTILSSASVIEFLVRGVQWDNLQGLEDYILANVNHRTVSEEEIGILRGIYDELFRLYCMAHANCSRLNTKIGDEFDLEYHTKGAGSRGVSGAIEKVLFDGYRKGNVVRKSVVWVKG